MSVTLHQLMAQRQDNVPYAYTDRDTMLYALATGMGRDPLDEQQLNFVFERRGTLRTIPSLAITVARHNLIYECGLNVEKMLHGEQVLTLHRPLPPAADLRADHRVVNIFDKGPAKGILIETDSRIRLADGTPLFDIYNLYFARGDGGIGSSGGTQKPTPAMPQRPPDMVLPYVTDRYQALLYRLTGDRNVIHADPKIARAMGFERPILHGSATLGIACRALVAGVCDYDSERIASLGTRFTAVVYPGERIDTEIWIDGREISFRCRAREREALVLDYGRCTLRA